MRSFIVVSNHPFFGHLSDFSERSEQVQIKQLVSIGSIEAFDVLDDFNREALAIEIDTSLPSERLVRVFEQLREERGLPDVLRTDNGPEFLGEVFVSWCEENGVMLDYIEPGKPNQNAFIERFNRSYRNEVLNTWLFRDLDEVREITWAWMLEYNEERDHDGLGGLTPAEVLANARISTLEWST